MIGSLVRGKYAILIRILYMAILILLKILRKSFIGFAGLYGQFCYKLGMLVMSSAIATVTNGKFSPVAEV